MSLVVDVLTAAHGADVLWITSPKLPALPMMDMDTSRGKRTTQLDLNSPEDHQRLTSLLKDADVFLQAYRPGGLASKGFSVDEVAKMRPGIVYASLTAYGWEGPWKDRRGVSMHPNYCIAVCSPAIVLSSTLLYKPPQGSTLQRLKRLQHLLETPLPTSWPPKCSPCQRWITLPGTCLRLEYKPHYIKPLW